MRVQHNRVAMNRYNSMTKTANNMQKTYEKLSSSYRINGATGKISTERSKFGSYMNALSILIKMWIFIKKHCQHQNRVFEIRMWRST